MVKLNHSDMLLLKAALRRFFSRSDYRKEAVDKLIALPKHSDPERSRVRYWFKCPVCLKPEAKSNFQVDHIEPVLRITETIDDLDIHTLLDRIICEKGNLQPICKNCHFAKSGSERKLRAAHRKKINGSSAKKSKLSKRKA